MLESLDSGEQSLWKLAKRVIRVRNPSPLPCAWITAVI
jgi:hypothetical protein